MVGWAVQPEIGLVGAQLIGPDGEIQHAGVDPRHARVRRPRLPGDAARLAVAARARRRGTATCSPSPARASRSGASVFERARRPRRALRALRQRRRARPRRGHRGLRNVCTPFTGVRHLEVGDPRHRRARATTSSPATGATSTGCSAATRTSRRTCRSPASHRTLRSQVRADARPADRRCPSGGPPTVFRQSSDGDESDHARRHVPGRRRRRRARSTALHAAQRGAGSSAKTINWFLPDIDSPFYGGINTALRLADHLARDARRREPLRRSGPAPNEPSSARRSPPRSRALADSPDRVPRRVARVARPCARGRRRDRHALGHGVLRRAVRRRGAEVLPDPGLRADVLPGRHAVRARRGELPARALRPLQHRPHAAALRAALRRPGHVVRARGRSHDLPRRRPALRPHASIRSPPCSCTPGPATGATAGSWRRSRWTSSSERLGDRVRIVTAGSWATPDDARQRHRAPRPARLPRDGRPLPHVRRRRRAHRLGAPVLPAARAHGLRGAGGRVRQSRRALAAARPARTASWRAAPSTRSATASSASCSTPSSAASWRATGCGTSPSASAAGTRRSRSSTSTSPTPKAEHRASSFRRSPRPGQGRDAAAGSVLDWPPSACQPLTEGWICCQ